MLLGELRAEEAAFEIALEMRVQGPGWGQRVALRDARLALLLAAFDWIVWCGAHREVKSIAPMVRSDPRTPAAAESLQFRYESASAPATTSRISCVISAWRARFICRVTRSISSPAFFEAFRIAVICAPWNEAADSSRAR